MLTVAKFGGSSLADGRQFSRVKEIVEADPARRIIVVSAPGKRFKGDNKVTDLLYLCHAHLQYGVACDGVWNMLCKRYEEIARECRLQINLSAELDEIRGKMDAQLPVDWLVSRGEYLTAKMLAEYLEYEFLDAKDFVCFEYDGKINYEKTYEALKRALAASSRLVIPGFYGAMPNGKIRIMSRGGSDISGALAAAGAEAALYENWTDVPGILIADPRIVKNPKTIARITYDELRELSYLGAEVLHEETVFPVRSKEIPINIRNTNDPSHPGTLIQNSFGEDIEAEDAQKRFLTGIIGRRHFSMIAVRKSHMDAHRGMMTRALEVFDRHGIAIEQIASGTDRFSIVVSTQKMGNALYDILDEIKKLCQPDSIQVTDRISLIAAVGRRMAFRPGISGTIFGTMGEKGINIRMISQGPDEMNITLGVDDGDFEKTIRVLYDSFIKED